MIRNLIVIIVKKKIVRRDSSEIYHKNIIYKDFHVWKLTFLARLMMNFIIPSSPIQQ